MANNPLLDKVMADYGQYLNKPAQGFAEGGNVPVHEANLKAYEEALANRPKIEKEKYSYKGYPLTYKNGKWEEDVPDTQVTELVPIGIAGGGFGGPTVGSGFGGGFGMAPQIFNAQGQPYRSPSMGNFMGGGFDTGPKYTYRTRTEPGYLLQYEYDPRQFEWDQYGRNIGKKPTLFGGSLGGLSMAGLGEDMFKVGSSVQGGFAEGGEVKGYAGGGQAKYMVDYNHLGGKMFGSTGVIDKLPQSAITTILNNPGLRMFMGFTPAPQEPRYYSASAPTEVSNGQSLADYERTAAANMANYRPAQVTIPGSVEELYKRYYEGGSPFGNYLGSGYAEGGEVKGYAEGGEKEEDPYAYAPIPAPEMQQNMAPNFMPLQTGQVEPSGGGYVPSQEPMAAPTMTTSNPALNAMLAQYTSDVDYSPELKRARADRRASEAAFNKSLDTLMSSADGGPSKAEMYYRLAAAFGTPSKTGAFGEGLAQAAGAMAETKKEERLSGTAKRKLAADIAMKKQELALESAKDTEKTLLGLQSEANKDRREFIKAQVKELIDSGKPQSNAGKIAKDKGLTPGTKEYQEEVDKQVNLEIEKTIGAIKAQLQTGNIALANLGIQQEKAQREAIKLEPDERKAIRDDEDAMFAAKSTIKNLNTAISFVDQAFTNTAADQAQYKKLKQTNPNDPRVKATEELENLIGQNVVGSLKTTFGGNPTEGERRALQELGGLGSANKEVRKAIMKRAAKALEEAADYRSARISKIETGGYRKKTEEK